MTKQCLGVSILYSNYTINITFKVFFLQLFLKVYILLSWAHTVLFIFLKLIADS